MMKTTLHVLAACLLASVSANAQERVGLSAEQRAAVEKLVNTAMSRDEVPALTLAIALQGELVWSAGFGMADLENFVPATAKTKIRTASISKWLTATAALRLVEEGKLNLDASPQSYCKDYPEKPWPMSVRQLLNHTSGVRHYHGENAEPQETDEQRRALGELQHRERAGQITRYTDATAPVAVFADDPLVFEPGTSFRYTSHGYRLLGCVLEGASGETYRALMARTVFGPAGMQDTVDDDAWAIVPRRAAGYSRDAQGRLRRADMRDVSENLAAGGHLSTAPDLVAFALAFNAGRLLAPATQQLMFQPPMLAGKQDPSRYAGFGRPRANEYYGLGVKVQTLPQGRRSLNHPGGQEGTSGCVELLPDIGFAVAVLMNKDESRNTRLCAAIRDALVTPAP